MEERGSVDRECSINYDSICSVAFNVWFQLVVLVSVFSISVLEIFLLPFFWLIGWNWEININLEIKSRKFSLLDISNAFWKSWLVNKLKVIHWFICSMSYYFLIFVTLMVAFNMHSQLRRSISAIVDLLVNFLCWNHCSKVFICTTNRLNKGSSIKEGSNYI